ncbi:unnamed protein product [Clavelina lepadiformis]|uniref:Uncharacterized protein n=1 Tax=Clavelina lepadiformis TaxID=159417 RepID=A0ABP0FB16_CLALP
MKGHKRCVIVKMEPTCVSGWMKKNYTKMNSIHGSRISMGPDHPWPGFSGFSIFSSIIQLIVINFAVSWTRE